MRQLCPAVFFIVALTASAQSVPTSPSSAVPTSGQQIADQRVELARQELQRVSEMVKAGALPRVRIDEAIADVEDTQDDAVLQKTLYGELPSEGLSDQMADEMVAAAQRRMERQQAKIQQAQKLVTDGIAAQSSLTPLVEELKMREMNVNLAHSRARLITELANVAKFQQNLQDMQDSLKLEYRDFVTVRHGAL